MTTDLYSLRVADQGQVDRQFPVIDRLGRQIGARAFTYTGHYEPVPEGRTWGYPRSAPGVVFCFRPGALRNGKSYGASHGKREFDTAAERDAAVEKYLAEAGKRAAKVKGARPIADRAA